MTRLTRATAPIIGALILSACTASGASLDRFEQRVESRSTCHTSTGDFVPTPGCSVSYSATETQSTTTTTTTTTTTPARDDD